MPNLTLTIDEELLKRARIRAIERGTSVNALVRDYLSGLVGDDGATRAVRGFLELTDQLSTGSGSDGRAWVRDELYDR